jgi:CheY-like chemotaxis protein
MEGYQVVTATNGKNGLEFLGKMPMPCLILLDLMMPIMNGWEMAEVLRNNTGFSNIPIVIISAYADKAKSMQVREIIKKPIDLDHLLKTVKTYCG